ncbi:MAG TPA: methyltransferase domain-containing protein [Candidatus Binatia bacterium]|nr:methyltransferase domain-containing protein [Candidatus Binatia bacterium]
MQPKDTARHRAHMPEGASRVLNARSLTTAHRRLAQLLRPGLTVLDVGCGTGAITRGIAEAVAPNGRVVGVDLHASLIEEARRQHSDVPSLSFETADVYNLHFHSMFDIVTAARVLQWLAHPLAALRNLVTAAKPGGRVVILEYNHEKIVWQPEPPVSMQEFYAAFLRWRAEAGMDNTIADHLPEMFAQAGLTDIGTTPQHELTRRSDPDFATRIGIWAEVAASRGQQMVADSIVSEDLRAAAETDYRNWIGDSAESQLMYLVAVEGTRPKS